MYTCINIIIVLCEYEVLKYQFKLHLLNVVIEEGKKGNLNEYKTKFKKPGFVHIHFNYSVIEKKSTILLKTIKYNEICVI